MSNGESLHIADFEKKQVLRDKKRVRPSMLNGHTLVSTRNDFHIFLFIGDL